MPEHIFCAVKLYMHTRMLQTAGHMARTTGGYRQELLHGNSISSDKEVDNQ